MLSGMVRKGQVWSAEVLCGQLRSDMVSRGQALVNTGTVNQCCGAGARGAEIILGPRARAENKF